MSDMELWPRIRQAIDAATVSRADVLVNLPTCHRKNCHGDHGDIDLVFCMFADRIAESIRVELLCKAVSEPDIGEITSEIDDAIEHRLAGGRHYHHRGCVHNLPPEDQVRMRGYTVEKWQAIVGPLPTQITPSEWRR